MIDFKDSDKTVDSNSTWKKADGFINITLEGTDGSYPKLGAIGLHLNKAQDKRLIEWLSKDPEGNSAKLAQRLRVNYRSAQPAAEFKLD